MTHPLTPVKTPLRQALHDDNRAVYLPAISSGYAAFALRSSFANGSLPVTARDLDFLDPANRFFHYPYALYSAGQHNTAVAPATDMVSQRDRSATVVLGDSGGFQVSTTPGYFTPALVLQNMRWMEAIADYSMVLDFPTGGIAGGAMAEHVERLNANGDLDRLNAANRLGLDYHACLGQTKLNNDAFVQNHAPGATAFLNVLQGRSEQESKFWYKAVKHYPFTGWAFAGHHQNRFSLMLARLLDMRDDGLLQTAEWIHVLGVSSLPIGVLLSVVQRSVRRLYNPTIQFSFDTASPFGLGANQRMFAGSSYDEQGWPTHYIAPTDLPASSDSDNLGDLILERLEDMNAKEERDRRVSRTAVSRLLKLSDIREPETRPEKLAMGRSYRLTPDGYLLVMHHNVEALADAHDAAHDTFFDPGFIGRFAKLAPSDAVSLIAGFIENILHLPTPEAMLMIRAHAHDLDQLRAD